MRALLRDGTSPHCDLKMIDQIDIKNFRGFKNLNAKFCRRVNVIVGENGVGKTALLEAIFLTLGSTPALAWNLKQYRGFQGPFQGTQTQIQEAFIGDYFHDFNLDAPISVSLHGTGVEARTLTIGKGSAEALLPFGGSNFAPSIEIPIQFTWTDNLNQSRGVTPKISAAGFQFEDSGEQLPDFFFFASSQPTMASETAGRFSVLSRARRHKPFIEIIAKEYPWIEDLNIEVIAGSPVIHATIKNQSEKVPLNSISAAISRVIGIFLAICVRDKGVVLIDEIENGIYYKHQEAVWRSVLSLSRENNCQIFVSSHSEEALLALERAADGDVNDIAFWRLERDENAEIILKQFSGDDLMAALDSNNEVR
jgi:hypothetical protein